jgi:hypothetical protein
VRRTKEQIALDNSAEVKKKNKNAQTIRSFFAPPKSQDTSKASTISVPKQGPEKGAASQQGKADTLQERGPRRSPRKTGSSVKPEVVHVDEDMGRLERDGAGSFDSRIYASLLAEGVPEGLAEDPTIIVGWRVMVFDRREGNWNMAVVRGPAASEGHEDGCNVVVDVSDGGTGVRELFLPTNFGVGKEDHETWFRIDTNKAVRERAAAAAAVAYIEFGKRTKRTRVIEKGDGHCFLRATERQEQGILKHPLPIHPKAATPSQLFAARQRLAHSFKHFDVHRKRVFCYLNKPKPPPSSSSFLFLLSFPLPFLFIPSLLFFALFLINSPPPG